MPDAKALAEIVGTTVRNYVARQLTPLLERLAAVEAREPPKGEPGQPGEPGKDGKDGVGFDDLSVEYDGKRTVTLAFRQADNVKEFPLVLPIVLDAGVYKEGEYQRGDAVTFAGSLWIAQKDTGTKPGGENPDWRLSVKRGRDGKDKAA